MSDDVQARLGSLLRAGVPEPPGEVSLDEIARRVNDRHTRVWLAPLVTAVIVGAICAGTILVVRGGSPSDSRRGNGEAAGSVSAIVGYRWRLVTVSRGGRPAVQVSRTVDYGLEFGPHGALLGSDSAEAFSGRYTEAGSSVTITKIAATTAGGAGPGHGKPDPVANAVLAAMRELFLPNGRESSTVSAAVSGTRLVTSKNTYQLTFRRQGRVPANDFAPASPTATTR